MAFRSRKELVFEAWRRDFSLRILNRTGKGRTGLGNGRVMNVHCLVSLSWLFVEMKKRLFPKTKSPFPRIPMYAFSLLLLHVYCCNYIH